MLRCVDWLLFTDVSEQPIVYFFKIQGIWDREFLPKRRYLIVYYQQMHLFVCFHGRPRQATDVLQPAGLLYRPLWTFKLWAPDAPVSTDAFRTQAAEV
jgi:hypothetical protein